MLNTVIIMLQEEQLPFCKISRCSHKISPVNGGALARKASLPIAQMSLPLK